MATESDKTSTGVIATIVVVGSFAMIAISAMVAAMVRSENAELERVRPTNADLETVAGLVEKQRARLNAPPSWVGEPGGKVAIPIATAMRLVVDEYQKDPLAASPPPPPGLVMVTTPAEAVPGAIGSVPGPGALPSNPAPSGAALPGGVQPSAPSTTIPASPAAPSAVPPSTPSNPAPAKPAPPSPAPPSEAPAEPAPPSPAPARPAAPSTPASSVAPSTTPPSKVEPVAPTSVGGP